MVDYPYVIVVNGKPETLFNPRDFEYLVEREMGHDAVEYFRRMRAEHHQRVRELEEELAEWKIADLED